MALRLGRRKQKNAKEVRPTKAKKTSRWRSIFFAVLVVLAIIALAFFLVVRDAENTSIAENAVGSVFTPINNAVSSAARYVRSVVNGAKDYLQMTDDLAAAQLEVEVLKLQLALYEEEARENERLKELLEARDQLSDSDPIYARVIARGSGAWLDTFTIDRGTADGIAVNMPVMTGDGLCGRVFEVGLNYAKVLSIIDPRSAIGAMIERTRDVGSMKGKIAASSTTAECFMYYLPAVNDIVPGDVVLTSGTDGMLPKGLAVGRVASVSRQSDLSDQYIVVMPTVDFLHIEEVLVLRVVVENEKSLAALVTPTPRPTPTPEPTPWPGQAEQEPDTTDSPYWAYPTVRPADQAGEADALYPRDDADETPAPTFDPDTMAPEDRWAY